jgi:hypothetical protein
LSARGGTTQFYGFSIFSGPGGGAGAIAGIGEFLYGVMENAGESFQNRN